MWTASLHGDTDHLDPEVAEEAEHTLRAKLEGIVGELVEAGHRGVAGVFHHSKGAPANLVGEGPGPSAPPTSAIPAGEVAAGRMDDVNLPQDTATPTPAESPGSDEPANPSPAEPPPG